MTLPAVLIDSKASCNVIDQATWEVLKKKSVQCESMKSSKKLFAYGQKDPIEVIGTFVSEIVCEISGNSCVDEFTVVKGPGRSLLGKNTAEKLGVFLFLFLFRSQTNIRNTRQSNHLNILRCRLATGQRSFSYRGAKLWNNLSNDLKNVNSLKAFKSKLTKQLLLT